MTWNYRVVHRVQEAEEFYGLHEVYYDDQDRPHLVTDMPCAMGNTLAELTADLSQMHRALDDGVLEWADIVPAESREAVASVMGERDEKERALECQLEPDPNWLTQEILRLTDEAVRLGELGDALAAVVERIHTGIQHPGMHALADCPAHECVAALAWRERRGT